TLSRLLEKTDFDSAHSIARLPRAHFVARFKDTFGGEDEAGRLHDQASTIHGRNMQVFLELNSDLNGAKTRVTGSERPYLLEKIAKNIPTIAALFQSQNYCDCPHCESAYSPAAYLVDLLHMLEHPENGADPTPFTALDKRRPDI